MGREQNVKHAMGFVALFIVVGTMAFSAACLLTVCCLVNAHEENTRRQRVAERALDERPLAQADQAQQQQRGGELVQPRDDDDDVDDVRAPGTSESPTYNIRTGAREGVVYSGTVV